jgi:dimethylamine monooxygenase subunit A
MKAARYFPVAVPWTPKPGIEKIGSKDHGNGEQDKKVFQIDDEIDKYNLLKFEQLFEQPYIVDDLSPDVLKAAMQKMCAILSEEYPYYFEYDNDNEFISHSDRYFLPCNGDLAHFSTVIRMVQEDVVIFSGEDKMVFAHVCFPSHWNPADKIGKSFAEIHEGIPGIEKINSNACKHVKMMVNTPVPLARFVWGMRVGRGLNKDDRVNENDAFFMTERQCIIGLPEVNASIFTIRVEPLHRLTVVEKNVLREVMSCMSEEELGYKGFNHPVIKERLYV